MANHCGVTLLVCNDGNHHKWKSCFDECDSEMRTNAQEDVDVIFESTCSYVCADNFLHDAVGICCPVWTWFSTCV